MGKPAADLAFGARETGMPAAETPFGPSPAFQQQPAPQRGMQEPGFGRPQGFAEPMQQVRQPLVSPPQPSSSETLMSKDLEIITYKLDTLKATLDNINHRLEAIEHIAKESRQPKKQW